MPSVRQEAGEGLPGLVSSEPDEGDPPTDPWHPTGPEQAAAPTAGVTLDLGALESARRASAQDQSRPTTLEERRPRLLVAGLTTAAVGPGRTS